MARKLQKKREVWQSATVEELQRDVDRLAGSTTGESRREWGLHRSTVCQFLRRLRADPGGIDKHSKTLDVLGYRCRLVRGGSMVLEKRVSQVEAV